MDFFAEAIDGDLGMLRAAAPDRRSARPRLDQAFVQPEGELETAIAQIWQRGLGIDRVGAIDSLFDLGGDSVFAGQVMARINRDYGIRLDFAEAFADITVRHLAQLVGAKLVERVESMTEEEAARLLGET